MNAKPTILSAAVLVARKVGLRKMTRAEVAKEAGCAPGTVSYNYVTVADLRTAVIRHAIEHEILPLIVEAIVLRHPLTFRMTGAVRRRALASLA
jgi:AcrR family transcriptional regulator